MIKRVIYIGVFVASAGLFLAFLRESMGDDSPAIIKFFPSWVYRIPAGIFAVGFFCAMIYQLFRFLGVVA